MTALPWLIIPGFLVPCLMFLHVVIFARLAKAEGATPTRCVAKRASGESGVTGSYVAGAPRERRRRANLAILLPPSRSDST